MSTRKHTSSHHKTTTCYDIGISYCGTIHCKLPYKEEEGSFVLLKDTNVYKKIKTDWEKQDTPIEFYFYDNRNKKVVSVDTKRRRITPANVNGKVLECNSRKLYEVLDGCWKQVCDLRDTESIVKLTTVTDEETIIIEPLTCVIDIHQKSDFQKNDITLGYKAIELDISSLEKGDAKTLVYKIEKKCSGKIILVNHIITRLPDVPPVAGSCETLFGTEPLIKGDLVRSSIYTLEDKFRATKIKPDGTITNTETIASQGSGGVVNYSTATDCHGNAFFAGSVDNSTITFGNIIIDGTQEPKYYIVKRNAVNEWIWAAETTGAGITKIVTDGDDIYAVGLKGGIITAGSLDTTAINALANGSIVVLKLSSAGVWTWISALYGQDPATFGTVAIDTDCNGKLYISAGGVSNAGGNRVITEPVSAQSIVITNTLFGLVAKIDSTTGLSDWIVVAQSNNLTDINVYDIAADNSGRSYITGIATGTITGNDFSGGGSTTTTTPINQNGTFFVASIDNDGYWRWITTAADEQATFSGSVGLSSIDVDNYGNVYFSSSTNYPNILFENGLKLTSTQGYYVFLAALNQNGGVNWAIKSDGNASTLLFNGMSVSDDGNVYLLISGSNFVNFDIEFGQGIHMTSGNTFVVKAKNDQWIWGTELGIQGFNFPSISIDSQKKIIATPLSNQVSTSINIFDLSEDSKERLKGIVQTDGDTTTEATVKWTTRITDANQTGLLPSYDYGVNVDGNLVLLCNCSHKKYPGIQYIGTSCSPTHLLLKKKTDTLTNEDNPLEISLITV